MILHLAPDAPAIVRAAAGAVLVAHIAAGVVGLAGGAAAFAFRKGGARHRAAGHLFFGAMLVMSAIGAVVAPLLPQHASVVPGLLTFYLVATGWMAARRLPGGVGPFEIVALLFALSAAALGAAFGLEAASLGELDGEGPANYFVFAGITALAAALDGRVLRVGGVAGPARMARHIWRMGLAMLIATTSFFLGQPRVFPPGLRGSPILFAPELIVLGLTIYWLVRTALSRRSRPRARPAPLRPALDGETAC